jgi:tetratricopeptide (TPR) repeat protein
MLAEYDVFLSHAWADGDYPQRIAEALTAADLRVWFDATEIQDFASITNAVVHGLAKSKVLLAYYSKTYPLRRACQWELTAAFLAAQTEGDPRKRVLVISPEISPDHIHPIELRDAKFRKAPETSEELSGLVDAICKHVEKIDDALGDIHPLDSPEWYGATPLGSTRFVGRFAEMWKIHSLLHAADVAQITGASWTSGRIGQVAGLGGIGKSLVAEEYALHFGRAYPGGIFWLAAYGDGEAGAGVNPKEREELRTDQMRAIAENLGLATKGLTPGETETAVRREIGRRGKPCLWIVDDVPSGLDALTLRRWFAPHSLARTLITTRSREYELVANRIDLSVLQPEDAYQLITSRRSPVDEGEMDQAHGLAADLGHHALALDVTASALKSYGERPYQTFRGELANEDADAMELAKLLADALPNGHEASISRTMLRSIRKLSPAGLDFLRLASILPAAPIPASLISAVFAIADGIRSSEPNQRQRLGFHEATSGSLAEIAGEKQDSRSVHTLVSRTVRFQEAPTPQRTKTLRAAAIKVLNDRISKCAEDVRSHRAIEPLIVHARHLVAAPTTLSEALLLAWVARYESERGAYGLAASLFQRELEFRMATQGPSHSEIADSMNNLAENLRLSGDLAAAQDLHERALAARRRWLGGADPDTLDSMNNLALILEEQGDLRGALRIQEQVLDITSRTLGPEDRRTLVAMQNIAGNWWKQGDTQKAGKIEEEVLAIRRRILGSDNPDTLTSMSNLAMTLGTQGDLTAARALLEEAITLQRPIFKPEHPQMIRALNNLAQILFEERDFSAARTVESEVLPLLRGQLGPEHPFTLRSAWRLFRILMTLGDRATARAILDSYLRWLLDRDPSTLDSERREARDAVRQTYINLKWD